MKKQPYSLRTDGSNDERLVKMNPLLVCGFDNEKGKVISQLLDMPCISNHIPISYGDV